MQVDSVISNSITQDIRLKGHQSIRFAPDGFSILISDASYTPVYLKQYILETSVSVEELTSECGRILDEDGLLSFEGETVLITDSMAVTLLPRQFFNVDKNREILEKVCSLNKHDRVFDRFIKSRDFYLIFAGTGKTTLVKSLVLTLGALKQKSVLLAPTGRAAKVLTAS